MTISTSALPRKLLRVSEVAAQLGISRSLAYRLVAAGDIESVPVESGRRVRPEAVDAYIARQEAKAR